MTPEGKRVHIWMGLDLYARLLRAVAKEEKALGRRISVGGWIKEAVIQRIERER